MSTIITVCHLKGGTGKTTTTILLATALTNLGYSVTVYDADPQGSASEWAALAADNNTPLNFPVTVANPATLNRLRPRTDYVLIDCPPGGSTAINAAINAADEIIIPTSPSEIEVDRMWDTLSLSTTKPTHVLITSARLGTTALTDIQKALRTEHIPTYRTIIPLRQKIKAMWGTNPTGMLYGYDTLANTITENIALKETA
ncbi:MULTISPECIES: AAA family ATPase [unclassified Corynebacterium]|uniref:AAA family ATPase n=1 Tax=unclassified Corynebacterium TaxID=2624378 RepID=UPI0029CA005B|nr:MULTISPECIES: AAA family ATPase [unclassified Corynebacterium]WPF66707.1 AAA family ATPase [Corynebacterium sp. 22KM0430]WPF69195.1 AAA family ATPase [Corynebacterium sp. 21KM1197]